MYSISVDRPVDVSTAIKVVSKANPVTTAEVMLHGEIRLIGVCEYEVLCLRKSEWLRDEREESTRIQISLI